MPFYTYFNFLHIFSQCYPDKHRDYSVYSVAEQVNLTRFLLILTIQRHMVMILLLMVTTLILTVMTLILLIKYLKDHGTDIQMM